MISGEMDLEPKLITFSIFDSVAIKVGFFNISFSDFLQFHCPDFFISGKVDEKATQLHAIASLKVTFVTGISNLLHPHLDLCLGPHLDAQVLLDATKPQDGVNGSAGGHAEEGQANGSEVPTVPLSLQSKELLRLTFIS